MTVPENNNRIESQTDDFPDHSFRRLPGSAKILITFFIIIIILTTAALALLCFSPLGKINYKTLPVSDKNSDFLTQREAHGKSRTVDINKEEFKDLDNTEVDMVPAELVGLEQTDKDIKNIVFLGLDVREEGSESGRSDVIMIVSVDQIHKKLRAASILRDCYVNIPNHGKNRINAAYAFGGPALSINTINFNFSTDIQKYVKVDFFGMAKIIDILGGIYIPELSEAEAGQIDRNIRAGKNIFLTGREAVAYARIRHIDSDFNRTGRQRIVLQQLVNKFFNMDLKEALPLLDEILPNVETNLTRSEILALGWDILTSGYDKNLENLCIPVAGKYEYANINGASVILPDISGNTQALKEFLYRKDS